MMPRTLKAFPTLLRIGFADAVAYRAEFLIWILATNMPLIMLALWTAVAREHPVGRYGTKEFTAYFLATLVVRLLTGCWVVWEMNFELRQGVLAFRMLRPVHPLAHYAAENIAALPLRALVTFPIALTGLFLAGGNQVTHDPVLIALFFIATFGAWVLNFVTMAIVGTFGFYIDSSLSLFQVWLGAYTVLSGYLIPLSIFPEWVRRIAEHLPFRFMLAFPVETVLGHFSRAEALRQLGIQWACIGLFLVLLNLTWRGGTKRFAAYGG